jgi:hypothetical protein
MFEGSPYAYGCMGSSPGSAGFRFCVGPRPPGGVIGSSSASRALGDKILDEIRVPDINEVEKGLGASGSNVCSASALSEVGDKGSHQVEAACDAAPVDARL